MKNNKKATVIALTSGVKRLYTSEELELHREFLESYHSYCKMYPCILTVREYIESCIKEALFSDDEESMQLARLCLAWTKMQARHKKFVSLLNRLGHIIGEDITKF